MRIVFADANYWIALCNRQDSLHENAVYASKSLGKRTRLLTSEPVLTEVLNGLGGKGKPIRNAAARLVESILNNVNVEVVPQTSQLFKKALDLYRLRNDKEWGLTDCSSFIIMKEKGLTEALTKDHHFAQAGYKPLLDEE